jgi:phosphoribosylformimino-5-aminoimidazole carboxamide ribotide isomerase
MKIIPAIDIIEGKCVRLTKGDYATKKVYNEDPLQVAKEFEDNGIQFLHLVDLDGAKSKRIINYPILETIASKTNLKIDFGGGLKSDEDVEIAFNSGANQVTGGSIAAKNRDVFTQWINKYGADKIILGADCKDRMISTNGWLEGSDLEVIEFIQSYEELGLRDVISTDIAKDGMLEGPSFELYEELIEKTNMNVIASGGVSSVNDLIRLEEIGCSGAILGKAIYEGNIKLEDLRELC